MGFWRLAALRIVKSGPWHFGGDSGDVLKSLFVFCSSALRPGIVLSRAGEVYLDYGCLWEAFVFDVPLPLRSVHTTNARSTFANVC